MISSNRTTYGTETTVSSEGSVFQQNKIFEEYVFDVYGGLTQGNHVDATDISFVKTIKRNSYATSVTAGYSLNESYSTVSYGPSATTVQSWFAGQIPVLDSGRLSDRVMEKIYEQLRGKANYAESIAEGHQAFRMLKSTLNLKTFIATFLDQVTKSRGYRKLKVRSSFSGGAAATAQQARKGLKRNNIRFTDAPIKIQKPRVERQTLNQRRLDYVTERWLEVRYGWMPLVHDIYNGLQTLNDFRSDRVYKVKARASLSQTSPRSQRSVILDGNTTDTHTYDLAHNESVRLERSFSFQLPNGLQLYDFTTLNPANLAWNLLPLSFVVDWVVNVGQTLELFENYTIYGNAFRSGSETWTSLTSRSGTHKRFYSDPRSPDQYRNSFVSTVFVSEGGTFVRKTKSRTKLFALPSPAGLRINVELNSKRLLDTAALMHQLIAKKIR